MNLAYLVAESLASDDRDFVAYPLVGLEVEGEFGVVSLDDDFGGLLDGLRANATHFDGVGEKYVAVRSSCRIFNEVEQGAVWLWAMPSFRLGAGAAHVIRMATFSVRPWGLARRDRTIV